MPALNIILEGEGCWPDLHEKKVIHTTDPISVAALPRGMSSGSASVAFRIDLPDGTVVVAETSMALFLAAARAFRARHGEQETPR